MTLCSPAQRRLLSHYEELWGIGGAFARVRQFLYILFHLSQLVQVCSFVREARRVGKAQAQSVARRELQLLSERLTGPIPSPIDPRVRLHNLVIDKCKVMSSAKLPLWLVWRNAAVRDEHVMFMFKSGDDLRQDGVTMQLLRIMDKIWRAQGLRMHMTLYATVPTWHDGGVLELVRNSVTTAGT